jgi:hypothetical protein
MDFQNTSYVGPSFDDQSAIVDLLPPELIDLLKRTNGFIRYSGGLHVRGVCNSPEWHSLEAVIDGALALSKAYPAVEHTDIPFAQDCVGDQFVLRRNKVCKLFSETGEIENYDMDLSQFLEDAASNPVEFLGLEPLLGLEQDGGSLQPGQLIHVYPPFCTAESGNGVSLKPVPVEEALKYLSDLANQITNLGEGDQLEIKVID